MTSRQQKAAAISRALRRDFGDDAAVISNMPLMPDQQLRIRVVDAKRDAVVTKLCEWGWHPQYLQFHMHSSTRNGYSLIPAAIYEVRIEEERQPIPDRKIRGEVEEKPQKSEFETEAVRRYLGIK
jgi:hypothetical protein